MLKNICDDDYKKIIEYTTSNDSIKALALTLIIFTGCRSNEVLSITHKEIDLTKGVSIHIIASKRGISRWIPLPDRLLARVKDLRDKLKATGKPLSLLISENNYCMRAAYMSINRFFTGIQNQLFGEAKYTIHSFRHTLAFRAFSGNKNIMQVKTILGHVSVGATARYLTAFESQSILSDVSNIVDGL